MDAPFELLTCLQTGEHMMSEMNEMSISTTRSPFHFEDRYMVIEACIRMHHARRLILENY